MRKIFILFLTGVLFLIPLTGCISQSASAMGNDSDYDSLIIGGKEYAPFFYINENGEYAGIDVEIAREACRRMGYTPMFVRIDWEEKDALLKSGEADCIWSCFGMAEDYENYLWAGPYMDSAQSVMVKTDSQVDELEDLKGLKVAVQAGQKAEEYFLKNNPDGEVLSFATLEHAFAAFINGDADAVAGHRESLIENAKSNIYDVKLLSDDILKTALGVAFDKNGNRVFTRALEGVLEDMSEDGTIEGIIRDYEAITEEHK